MAEENDLAAFVPICCGIREAILAVSELLIEPTNLGYVVIGYEPRALGPGE
jgi:hypothetical protein